MRVFILLIAAMSLVAGGCEEKRGSSPTKQEARPPASQPSEGTGAVSTALPIRCDQFVVSAVPEERSEHTMRVRLSIKTDLPDTTEVTVNISRYYTNAKDGEEYAITYFMEKATIGGWRTGRAIELDHRRGLSTLEQTQALFKRSGKELKVTKLQKAVRVDVVVPINQSDPRFGKGNENLVGAAVQEEGLRVVRSESQLDWPVSVP
jgi:hypothetical protein